MIVGIRKEIVNFITEYYERYLFYPNYDEIAEGVKRAKTTVHTHMKRLEQEGVIIRKQESSNAYRLGNMDCIIKNTSHCKNENKKQTQADRIRSMSDEELAEFLPIVSDLICNPTDECMKQMLNRGDCTEWCALKWLQSESEG